MIKIIKSFGDGRIEPTEVNEWDFGFTELFEQTFQKMQESNCHTIIVETSFGNVLFTMREKVGNV